MFALVIGTDASLDHLPLTYAIPDYLGEVRKGFVVTVPFREELMHAVVVDVMDTPGDSFLEEIRPIVSVDVNREVLAPYQITAVIEAAKAFFLHAHKALSLFLSAPYLRQSLKKWGNTESAPRLPEKNSAPQKIELISVKEWKEIWDYVSYLSSQNTKTFVIFPYEVDAKKAYEKLPEAIQKETLFIEEELPEVKEFRIRETLLQDNFRFVFWSRRILLYNAAQYERFVFVEDAFMKTFTRSFHTLPYLFFLEVFAKTGKHISIFSKTPQVADFVAIRREEWILTPFS